MTTPEHCPECGRQRTATDPADVCVGCGASPADWRQPHAADPINDDDEMVIENSESVTAPGGERR